MKKNISAIGIIFFFFIFSFQLRSQDLIVKTNGDSIPAKITEVNINAVTYLKSSMPNGPTFIIKKDQIAFIRYSNGEVEHLNKIIVRPTTSAQTNTTNGQQKTEGKNKIEFLNGEYSINGQPASSGDVDRYLGKSKNPAVLIPLKATMLTAKAQKISKITSIPTTIVGGFATLFTLAEGYQLVQRGRATTKSFVNIGISFVSTLAMPLTSKILKKKSDKMRDKIIDMYNLTN